MKIAILLINIIAINAFNLGENEELKSFSFFKPSFLFDIFGGALGPLQLSSLLIKSSVESDYLNELAQNLADLPKNQCPFKFASRFPESPQIKNVLNFGLKIRGNLTLEEILMHDPTRVFDHMSGFMDFKYQNTKISIFAEDIRDFIQAESPGYISFTSEDLKHAVNLDKIGDLTKMFEFYRLFMDYHINSIDKSGNIFVNFDPMEVRMEIKNFRLKLKTQANASIKLNQNDTNGEKEFIIEDYYRKRLNLLFISFLNLINEINQYGFGISMDSNNEITLVYSFGINNRSKKEKTFLKEKFFGFNYELGNGESLNLNPFDFEDNLIIKMKKITNKLVMNTLNYYSLRRGLSSLKNGDYKMYTFAQSEANRQITFNKLNISDFQSIDKSTVLFYINLSGQTKLRELFFGFDPTNEGMILCSDNFSTDKSFRIFKIYDINDEICNKEALDKLRSFNCFTTGIAYNSNADLFSTIALSSC